MKNPVSFLGRTKTATVKPYLPEGVRVYCVGDIHGRADLLTEMHEKIRSDIGGFEGRAVLIYIGDYIDRGMHSREVVEVLLDSPFRDEECHYLRGNHEQAMLDFMQDAAVGPAWLSFGGQATLASYGAALAKIPFRIDEFRAMQKKLEMRVPAAHLEFFMKTKFSYTEGSYFFVHAGVNPRRSLARQMPEDLLWIRDEFIGSTKCHGKIVVHGHTVTDAPEVLPNRIGIDTGAYATGKLTCLVLQADKRKFLQTGH